MSLHDKKLVGPSMGCSIKMVSMVTIIVLRHSSDKQEKKTLSVCVCVGGGGACSP